MPERAILENFSTRAVDQKKVDRPLAKRKLQELVDRSAAAQGRPDWDTIRSSFLETAQTTHLEKEADLVCDLLSQWQAASVAAPTVRPYDWRRVREFTDLASSMDDLGYPASVVAE